jgi:hypothetical protein
VPPAVDGESDRAEHVHPLIDGRLAGETAGGQQAISEQDEDGAGPADDFNQPAFSGPASKIVQKVGKGQAASLLST